MVEGTEGTEGNQIPDWCTHGSSDRTYFRYSPRDARHFWWCTHGAWEIETDNQGKVLKSWFLTDNDLKHLRNFKIDKYFTYSEYMQEFGNQNPYE